MASKKSLKTSRVSKTKKPSSKSHKSFKVKKSNNSSKSIKKTNAKNNSKKNKKNETTTRPIVDNNFDDDDVELSEEGIEFFKNNCQYTEFLKNINSEQEYERKPRRNKDWITQKFTKLPIKLPDGKIKQPKQNPNIKEELAETSQKITEDPENNIGQLKYLREFAKDENLTIKKLAFYRIRLLSDKEKVVQIKKIRHFEQSLLVNYQEYLRSLEAALEDELDIKQKSNSENSNNKIKGIKRKRDKHEPVKHLTRKMKKLEKERKIIENEMKEAEAVVDKEEREKTHTETLKLVFTTYFRILKYAKTSPLLLSVLEGLTNVTTEHQLLMKGFDFMFFKRRTIPIERSAAFLKRLSISCLNWPNKTVLSCLEKIEKMIQRQSKLEALLTSDDRAYNGIYRPELDDPELCNPFATSLWELNLLENHYDPKIRAAAHTLSTYKSQKNL
ncbi:3139_t:CDS:10 [Diversispora eburnea]|uniref:3139_t:CDS:1 n=1 Tax=Diversispora eburnea TaxID=1213867 RepID=A0A9N9F984_9GLOM|nr:3139_t:CDS:10 [Diversispora eburnea]